MTDVTPSSDRTVFDELLAEDADRRMHYGALYYAQHGIPVFPINIITDGRGKAIKKPGIKGWPSEATTNPAVINSWWGSGGTHEGCLIGAVTGARSGWGVIDVDVKDGGQGEVSLQKLADELMPLKSTAEFAFGQLLPQERLAPVGLVRTRSGGLHLWYPLGERAKTRGRNKVRGLPNLEFKATGHYVVVAPSDGYEWLKLIPTKDEWDTPVEEYLAGLPVISEALLERLLDGAGDTDDGSGADGDEIKIIVQGRGSELLKSAVKTLMSTPDGEGNDTVYKLCCDLYPYVALGEVTKVEVDQAIWAGIRNWGADEGSIRGTMGSAWKRTGERTIKFNTEMIPISSNGNGNGHGHAEIPPALLNWVKQQSEGRATTASPVLSVVPDDACVEAAEAAKEELSDDPEDRDLVGLIDKDTKEWSSQVFAMLKSRVLRTDAEELYRIYTGQSNKQSWMPVDVSSTASMPQPRLLLMNNGKGLLYEGETNMVWGLRSAGKTWLENLVILEQVRAGKHVVLVDYENGRAKIRYRLQVVGLTEAEINEYVHVVISPTGPFPVKSFPVSMDKIGAMIIDSMTGALRSLDLDSRSGDDVETFIKNNVKPFTEAGVGTLIIDHVPHNGESHDRPINSVHKLNRVQGAGYLIESEDPFVPGRRGSSTITLFKDNGGGVGPATGEVAGRLIIDSPGPDQPVTIYVDADVTSLNALAVKSGAVDRKAQELVDAMDAADIEVTSQRETKKLLAEAGIRANAAVLVQAMKIRRERDAA